MKDIPIYLVSLESDVKRREELKKIFLNTYKEFIHIKAVDGRKLTAKDYYDKTIKYFLSTKKIMSPSELGCTLSHMEALSQFLNSDSEFALILEDDVIGKDSDIENILNITKELNSDSLFICGGLDGLPSMKQVFVKKIKEKNLFTVAKFSYPRIFRTCCYVVTKNSAKEILNKQNRNITLADKWNEFFIENKNIKIYYSNILSHPEDLTNSHIESDRLLYNQTNLLKKIFSITILEKVYSKLKFFTISQYSRIKGYRPVCD